MTGSWKLKDIRSSPQNRSKDNMGSENTWHVTWQYLARCGLLDGHSIFLPAQHIDRVWFLPTENTPRA